jgi:hypothetical protein
LQEFNTARDYSGGISRPMCARPPTAATFPADFELEVPLEPAFLITNYILSLDVEC